MIYRYTEVWLSLHYNAEFVCLWKRNIKFKANNENDDSPTQFRVGNIPNGFSASESREISLYGYVYGFSVDYNSIDKSDI